MLPDTAAERAQHVLNTLLGYREKQKLQVANPLTASGDVTSVNLTTIHVSVIKKQTFCHK